MHACKFSRFSTYINSLFCVFSLLLRINKKHKVSQPNGSHERQIQSHSLINDATPASVFAQRAAWRTEAVRCRNARQNKNDNGPQIRSNASGGGTVAEVDATNRTQAIAQPRQPHLSQLPGDGEKGLIPTFYLIGWKLFVYICWGMWLKQ